MSNASEIELNKLNKKKHFTIKIDDAVRKEVKKLIYMRID